MLEKNNNKLGKNNKQIEEPEPLWPLLLVAALLAVTTFAISLSADWWGNTVLRSALVTALVLIVLTDIQIARNHYRKRVQGIPKSDERSERVGMCASTYSFRVGIFFMIALIFLHLSNVLAMDAVIALSGSVFVMAGTFLVSLWYFDRKGDVA